MFVEEFTRDHVEYQIRLVPKILSEAEIEQEANQRRDMAGIQKRNVETIEYVQQQKIEKEDYVGSKRRGGVPGFFGGKKAVIRTRDKVVTINVPVLKTRVEEYQEPLELFKQMVKNFTYYEEEKVAHTVSRTEYNVKEEMVNITVQLPPRPITDFLAAAKKKIQENLRLNLVRTS